MNCSFSSRNSYKLNLLPPSRPRRIGLLAHGFANWGGGLDFLRLTANSLRQADPEIELHVLVPTRGLLVQLRNFRDWTLARLSKASTAMHRPELIHLERAFTGAGAILHQIDLGQYSIATACRRLKLDALLPAISPQSTGHTPWVGYIYDFQHKYLPQFFSERERLKRDQVFEQMLNSAKAVVVNAMDVINDIEYFYPNHSARVFVMPFSPAASSDAFSVAPEDACLRYGLRKPYFIICNQFWKHKDHGTAFKAFAALSARHPELSLVCTGATSDYRFPGYFDKLMDQVRRDGIADRIRSLGLIPKLDQLALLRGAVALIQPTLFEGGPGGGAVYDAVSLGKRSIVSAIPVNTEINDPTVTFFKAGDAEALAVTMEAALVAQDTPSVSAEPSTLIQLGIERRRACGELLLQALSYAMKTNITRYNETP